MTLQVLLLGDAPVVQLVERAKLAEANGYGAVWVADERFYREVYSCLGQLAAHTANVLLGPCVTDPFVRHPALTAMAIGTLDEISGGRAILGIGAAWNEDESKGLGLLFPPVSERFERLEEAILIMKQMWSGDQGPFDGKHYHLARTLNSPQALSRPHPPILIGGSGEKKTLRLVARYADSCNIFAGDVGEAARKLGVLRQHCANEEKTAQTRFDLGENGENVQRTIEGLHEVAESGFTVAHGSLIGVSKARQFDFFAERVIPALEKF